MTPVSKHDHKGWLYKWTNYLKGYQRRWFVLNEGGLSYFRSQAEMGHTCRGTISLVNAKIELYDSLTFVVSNGNAQTYHLRASNVNERKEWVNVLKIARDSAQEYSVTRSGDALSTNSTADESESDVVNALRSRLKDLETFERMVCRDGDQLLRALSQLQEHTALGMDDSQGKCTGLETSCGVILEDHVSINEKSTAFKVTVNAMVNSLKGFVEFANGNARLWQRQLSHEKEQRARMEKMVEELAKQHSALERQVQNQAVALHRQVQTCDVSNDTHLVSAHSGGSNSSQPLPSICTSVSPLVPKLSAEGESEEDDAFFDALSSADMYEADTFCVSLPSQLGTVTGESLEHAHEEALSCYSGSSDDEEDDTVINSNTTLTTSGGVESIQVVRVITRKKQLRNKTEKVEKICQPCGSPRPEVHQDDNQDATALTPTPFPLSQSTTPTSTHSLPAADVSKEIIIAKPSDLSRTPRQRRCQIPPRPNISVNLWSIMKNCIGKELTKIPVPVNFNEPLSMLQRVIEDYEYSSCLDAASKCTNSIEQMAYVATFSVTAYSTTKSRTGKPFNPLLGETYECDRRDDFGWRAIVEQVSHHPPALAVHCESDSWTCWQEFTVTSKFRGKYLSIVPQGSVHLKFKDSEYHYTWNKVTTTVHNIIVGRLWIDNHGEMDIFNHATGETCHLSYKPYSYFSRDEPRRVMGVIYDKAKRPRYMLRGTWDSHMEGAPITAIRNNDWETGPWTSLWRKSPDPPHSEIMYNFTHLAVHLNEYEENVAPTDSRLRPDIRLMEEARWDEANREKERLEEKQRAKRRAALHHSNELQKSEESEVSHVPYEPKWFKPTVDPITGMQVHLYNGLYWECKEKCEWTGCPDIF